MIGVINSEFGLDRRLREAIPIVSAPKASQLSAGRVVDTLDDREGLDRMLGRMSPIGATGRPVKQGEIVEDDEIIRTMPSRNVENNHTMVVPRLGGCWRGGTSSVKRWPGSRRGQRQPDCRHGLKRTAMRSLIDSHTPHRAIAPGSETCSLPDNRSVSTIFPGMDWMSRDMTEPEANQPAARLSVRSEMWCRGLVVYPTGHLRRPDRE